MFFAPARLRPGDRAEVTRADGVTVTFRVDRVRTFAEDAFTTAEVYGGTAGPELRLITSGGTVDPEVGSYRDNIVVFAREAARSS